MDVLAALSLVGNIFQFVDFTTKIVSKSAQLYRSSDGALEENIDIEATTKDLVLLNEKLKDAATDMADAPLQSLCKSCNSVADELLAALTKLKLQSKQNRWESIQKALQSVWSKEKIRGLEGRLARFRDELNLHIMIDLREQVSQLKLEQLGLINQDATTQRILDAVIEQQKILHRAELQNQEQSTSLIKKIRSQTDEMGTGLSQQLRLLEASIASVQTSQMRLEQSISTQIRDMRISETRALAEEDDAPQTLTEPHLPTGCGESTDMNREYQGAEPCVEIDTRVCECSVKYSRYVRLFSGIIRVRLSSKHMPTCIYSKNSKYLEISATCHLPQLWKMMTIGFTADRDAGRYSLAPTISVTRIVDRRVNPAFLLLQNIQNSCSEVVYEWCSQGSPKKEYFTLDKRYSYKFCLKWDTVALDIALRKVLLQIPLLFATGQSSALDTDVNGNTLLHEIVRLATMVEETSGTTKALFRALIMYVISAGAVKDAEARELPRTLHDGIGNEYEVLSRAYNIEFTYLNWNKLISYGCPSDIVIWDSQLRLRIAKGRSGIDMERLFMELDLDTSNRLPTLLANLDSLGFADFVRTRPHIASDLGYGKLALAVIKRDKPKLDHLLTQNFDPDDTWRWSAEAGWWNEFGFEEQERFPPLALALGWLDGVESLLKAGSNPLLAFAGLACPHPGSKESILALLRYDIPLSIHIPDPHRNYSLASKTAALRILKSDLDVGTKMAVVETLIAQRVELKNLALKVLSSVEKMSFGLKDEDGVLPDIHATAISIVLTNKGVKLPTAITVSSQDRSQMNARAHLDYHASIYHLALPRLSPKIADFLFRAGFKDMDVMEFIDYSDFKITPLFKSCLFGYLEMACWFLEKGACPVLTADGIQTCALSVLGRSFRKYPLQCWPLDDGSSINAMRTHWLKKLDDLRLIPKLLESAKANTEVCCPCFCSEDDITHVSVWMRSSGPGESLDFPTKLELMAVWLELLHVSTGTIWKCWQAFFRAEIFERLGLAHTCHHWTPFQAYEVSDENERCELRNEDIKAGLVADLEFWMQKYNTMENSFIQSGGSLDNFVAAWILELNQELFENETLKGIAVEANVDFNPASYILGLKALHLDNFPWDC